MTDVPTDPPAEAPDAAIARLERSLRLLEESAEMAMEVQRAMRDRIIAERSRTG